MKFVLYILAGFICFSASMGFYPAIAAENTTVTATYNLLNETYDRIDQVCSKDKEKEKCRATKAQSESMVIFLKICDSIEFSKDKISDQSWSKFKNCVDIYRNLETIRLAFSASQPQPSPIPSEVNAKKPASPEPGINFSDPIYLSALSAVFYIFFGFVFLQIFYSRQKKLTNEFLEKIENQNNKNKNFMNSITKKIDNLHCQWQAEKQRSSGDPDSHEVTTVPVYTAPIKPETPSTQLVEPQPTIYPTARQAKEDNARQLIRVMNAIYDKVSPESTRITLKDFKLRANELSPDATSSFLALLTDVVYISSSGDIQPNSTELIAFKLNTFNNYLVFPHPQGGNNMRLLSWVQGNGNSSARFKVEEPAWARRVQTDKNTEKLECIQPGRW